MSSNFCELSAENFLFQNQTKRKKENGNEVSDVVQPMEPLDKRKQLNFDIKGLFDCQ